jgi:hypothetical protein
MLNRNLALVADTKKITPSQLTKVAAALQKQATRDFGPIWEIDASVSAFARLEDVPSDYWPIIVRDDIKTPGAAGVHEDKNGQPFALVQYGDGWSLTASHETLEMLGDPFGNRLVGGGAPQRAPKQAQGRVNFLVEVCDPSEGRDYAYTVNGITVSDFYTPHFFDPVAAGNVRYSYTGAIREPRTILKDGYLSWVVPKTNEWFQMIWFNSPKPTFRSLGVLAGKITGSLRATIDRLTPTPLETAKPAKSKLTADRRTWLSQAGESSAARAKFLRQHIEEIKKAK